MGIGKLIRGVVKVVRIFIGMAIDRERGQVIDGIVAERVAGKRCAACVGMCQARQVIIRVIGVLRFTTFGIGLLNQANLVVVRIAGRFLSSSTRSTMVISYCR